MGKDKWNGFGGKMEEEDKGDPHAAIIREVRDETGLTLWDAEKVGTLEFRTEGERDVIRVYVFVASRLEGELQLKADEIAEAKWFSENEIPYQEMWPDDEFWLPLLLKGKGFDGKFKFGKDGSIVDCKLEVLEREAERASELRRMW